MLRKARIDAPGTVHHIIIRGIERKPIFKDDFDRNNFLERLVKILTETVEEVLIASQVKMNRKYELGVLGVSAKKVAMVSAKLMNIRPELIYSPGKDRTRVQARSLFVIGWQEDLEFP